MELNVPQKLESLSGWGSYEEITTKSGPFKVKRMQPTTVVWDLWNHPKSKRAMNENGFTLQKDAKGKTWLYKIEKLMSDEKKKALIEESRASASNANLLIAAGQKYLEYQKAGIKYAIDRFFGHNGAPRTDAVLIADGMGLGKTLQSIGVLNQDPNIRDIKVLVVCPASLKLNWRKEFRKFMIDGIGNDVYVVKKTWPNGLLNPNMVIVNYDVLHKFHDDICNTKWDYVIFDEAHYLKNEKARWTVHAFGGMRTEDGVELLTRPIPADKRMFLTGTPVPNRVREAWALIKACDPKGLGANHKHFIERYDKTNENLHELQERMRTRFMIRRLKDEVFDDFPEKTRSVYVLDPAAYKGMDIELFKKEMSIFNEYQALLKTWQIATELAKARGNDEYLKVIESKRETLGMKASELMKLRMKTAIAKAPAVAERVIERCEGGANKIIVFGIHHEVMDIMAAAFKKAGLTCCILDGRVTSIDKRQKMVDDFQAGLIDVFIGGLKPAGVGWTLTRSTIVIFAEQDFVPGNMTQGEDRAHRIGQKNAVQVEHAVLEGSLDEWICAILVDKQDTIERVLDRKEADDTTDDTGLESAALKDKACTHGVKVTRLTEEGLRMSEKMRFVAEQICHTLYESKAPMGDIDTQLLAALQKEAPSLNRYAVLRRIALKYGQTILGDYAETLKWEKQEDKREFAD